MYSILRLNKIKNRAQLAAAQNHNLRLKPVSNCDPAKSHLNMNSGAKSYKELVAEIEDKFYQHNIKPRIDSVQAVEVILSASPEFFEDNDTEKLRQWANENYKWAKKEFGTNLLQFTLHRDETTPHIHMIFTPITSDGRLSCKDLYGGAAKLSALQNRYAEAMAKFGLKRGNKKSKSEHTDIKEFYTLVQKLKNLSKLQLKIIAHKLAEFDKQNNKLEATLDYNKLLEKIIKHQKQTVTPSSSQRKIKRA